MDPSFWKQSWREGKIGFHQGRPNPLLAAHHQLLGVARRVLVPLAGKAFDVAYLASLGHRVVAIELVEDAVRAFFDEQGLVPEISRRGDFVRYAAGPGLEGGDPEIVFFAGDFFATTKDLVGPVNALYDRAALVALPPALRDRYVPHVLGLLSADATALIVSLEYDEAQRAPPPHSVPEAEVHRHFDGRRVTLLADGDGLEERHRQAGVTWMREKLWTFAPN